MMMSTVQDRISKLTDTDACRILANFASHQPGYHEQPLTPEVGEALRSDPELSASVAGEGDLARAALVLLADDPLHRPIIEAMVTNPAAVQYGLVETALVVSGVLFVLGMHVKFERGKAGKWTIKVEKKPTDNKLLKGLMQKLLGFAGVGGES
jgi:hypothetical protein